MLDDLFSSSKGPGIIGLVLGLMVLAGFCGLGFAVFDGRLNGDLVNDQKSQHNKNEGRIANLKERIVNIETRMESRQKRKADARKLSAAKITMESRQSRIAELGGEEGELSQWKAKLAAVETDWMDYKAEYRLVAAARMVGTKFESLKTMEGKEYSGVTVTRVDALEMGVSHKNGGGSIKLAVLSAKLQDTLQYDPEIAKIVQAKLEEDAKVLDVAADMKEEYNKITKDRRIHVDAIRGLEHKIRNIDRQVSQNKRSVTSLAATARREWTNYSSDKAAGRGGTSRADDRARSAEKRIDQTKSLSSSLKREASQLEGEITATEGKMNKIDKRLAEMAAEVERRRSEKNTPAARGTK